MWRPWSKALEILGRLRFPISWRRSLRVGDPDAPDARGTTAWRGYLGSERLFDVWGPHPESPWVPFHCVPLFAALDSLTSRNVGPTPEAAPRDERLLPPSARPGAAAPRWAKGGTWIIVDLPGPACVTAGAWLVGSAGCQPVCTFDNWPHAKGVLRSELVLAELLYWASTVSEERAHLRPDSPPVWICDAERLGGRPGQPGEFDNRYYLDDSILPGPMLLRRAGVSRVVYVTSGLAEIPVLDLEGYFADLLSAGIPVLHVDLSTPDAEPLPLSMPRKRRKMSRKGYRRSGAGGFGSEVPQPSEGGGGG
jgi:hypothetical protein